MLEPGTKVILTGQMTWDDGQEPMIHPFDIQCDSWEECEDLRLTLLHNKVVGIVGDGQDDTFLVTFPEHDNVQGWFFENELQKISENLENGLTEN